VGEEKRIFKDRALKNVFQTKLQKYLMEELLGIDTEFVSLVPEKKAKGEMTWAEAFGCIDMNEMLEFAIQMAKNVSEWTKVRSTRRASSS
jgi:hypothetical protein